MIDLLRKIKKPKYESLNKIVILKNNLIFNYQYLQSLQAGREVWPVLKSNAYGHGLKQVCQILNDTDCRQIVVDSFPEAQIVYKYFKGKVLLLGEAAPDSYRYCDFKRTEFVVYNSQTIDILANIRKKAKIHLFINTGMNREGVHPEDLDTIINQTRQAKKIKVVGICSHFASADSDSDLNTKQLLAFKQALTKLKEQGIEPIYRHLGNSAGSFTLQTEDIFNVTRPGLAFYGYNPFPTGHKYHKQAEELKPALQVFSKITSIQDIKTNEIVSYNATYQAIEDTRIATIPFGYYEGLDRRYSNQAQFQVLTKDPFWAQIAGRVCMNLTSLDCADHNIQLGDKVKVVSERKQDQNSIQNLATVADTIPYEILTKLRTNIRRETI